MVLEGSHFLGTLAGFSLLIVAWGLARRLAAAYCFAVGGLVLGLLASILKGGDYEEAIIMVAILAMLVAARREFDRTETLFEVPFSPAWRTAISAVVLGSLVLGLFAYRHVDYSNQLWWLFDQRADAPRFLRAMAGVLVAMLGVGLHQWLRPPAPEVELPDAQQLADAARVVARHGPTSANLVFLRDKGLMWSDGGDAFVMYGVWGRTWVALGDPVGPRTAAEPLVKRFVEHADDYQGIPVFYQATREWLPCYDDFGLTFAQVEEEARVRLPDVADDSTGETLRQAVGQLTSDAASFRVIEPASLTVPLMGELRAVSDEWLAARARREEGFSRGIFDEQYLARSPIAVIERNGRLEAFASMWFDRSRRELAVDLLRHRALPPAGTIDALLAGLMQWGRTHGFEWLTLGVTASLPGRDKSLDTPLWSKIERLVHGDGPSENRGELRICTAQLQPERVPRYLAYPGGLALTRVLADVSALIAGEPARQRGGRRRN
jgi:phosphatidylglycerol lysyltransferase